MISNADSIISQFDLATGTKLGQSTY